MKKKYEAPEMEVEEFDADDIITTSGCSCDNINAGGPSSCMIHSSCMSDYTGDPD